MSIKKEDFAQTTFSGKTIAEETLDEARARIPEIIIQCPFCFVKATLRAWARFNDSGERLAKVQCSNCKRNMTEESTRASKDAFSFGKWVAKYKFFWKQVDHDKWINDFKTAFPKEYQEAFWEAYKQEKPEFAERQEIEKQTREYEASFK